MNNDELARLFVAVDMPPAVIDELKRVQKILKARELFDGRFTDTHQMHITLSFIGEVATDQLPSIEQALQTVCAKCMPARLGAVDVFSRGQHVKVVLVHVVCPELAQLAQKVNATLMPWHQPEERAFVSHLTLARVKKVEDVQKLLGTIRNLELEPIAFTIDSFVLKQSVLTGSGPEYTDIAHYTLTN